jgi:hypothetical protein
MYSLTSGRPGMATVSDVWRFRASNVYEYDAQSSLTPVTRMKMSCV